MDPDLSSKHCLRSSPIEADTFGTAKMPSATALIVPAVKKHTATVIMAHGLGDSGAGWISLAENWRRRQKFEEVKFIFPNAPSIPITVVCLFHCPLPNMSLTAHRTSE